MQKGTTKSNGEHAADP